MIEMSAYTAYRCPSCASTAPGMLWRQTEAYCEDCGSHPAAQCPLCDEVIDLVFTEADRLIDATAYGRAVEFAAGAHGAIDQRRKYSGEAYIVHPLAVARLVRELEQHTEAMLVAAVLHDVVEDTPVKRGHLEMEFGSEVLVLVDWLTDISTPPDGNRALRKAKNRLHLAMAPADAKTIKLADLLDNGVSIRKHDPDFWRVYRAEALRLLEVMKQGDSGLWLRVEAMCSEDS
jgi:(p)ppGpp synthase/HD superfamily hydrolase